MIKPIEPLAFLPEFARYLLENHLNGLSRDQLILSRTLKLPLLEYFKHLSESELIAIGADGISKLLTAIRDQQINEYIAGAILDLRNNQIPLITRDKIHTEDIVILSFMRRKLFRDRLPFYNSDARFCLNVMGELDFILTTLDSKVFEALSEIQIELFDQAQAISHIGNWVLDLRSNSITWSKELFNIYRLPVQDIVTYDLAGYNHPDDGLMVSEKMRLAGETYQPCEFTYRIIIQSGEIRFLHARVQVFLNNAGIPEKMFGTVQDVTDQKKMEEELNSKSREMLAQETRYQKMVNEVEDYAILLLSKEGIIENWNLGAEKIKGYKAEEIVGKHLRTFYTKEDQESRLPEQLIHQAIQYGKANHEGWRIRKDGSRFWGSIVISALHDRNGEVIGMTKMTRDLTLRKLAEDNLKQYSARLEKQNAELEQKNQELESFNYIAGHDLQEPLRKIRVWLNKVYESAHIPEDLVNPIARIKASSDRMQLLINGILEYSQTNLTNLPRERVDLNGVLDEVFADLTDSIEHRDLEITKNTFPVITGVRIQFYQLFYNIISNSIKYSHPDQPLIIICHAALTTSAEDGKTHHQLVFSDTGIGFKQEYSDKIFDLFKRLDPGFSSGGTGLGLAICKKIVQNHQGSITATSEPGKGTSIEILLPSV